MSTFPVTTPPTSTALRSLVLWVISLGFGGVGYGYLTYTLSIDVFKFIVLLLTLLIISVTALLGPIIDQGKSRKKWLWMLIPLASCLFMYSTVLESAAKLKGYPTPEVRHQLGLRTVAFLLLIFIWIHIVPARVSWEANTRLRKSQFAVAVAVALAQIILGGQFLREIWPATSIDQVRTSMGTLVCAGLALYLFLVAKTLLPRTVSDIDAFFDKKQSNATEHTISRPR
jgi:hypothetical protein